MLADLNEEALKETAELIKKENSNAEVLSIKAGIEGK